MRPFLVVLALFAIAGCVGRIGVSSRGGNDDAGIGLGMDSGVITPPHDSGTPGNDAWSAGNDAWSIHLPDAWSPPVPDAWSPPIPDAYVPPDPTCTSGTPLSAPIAGCMPTPLPSTGDPRQDCVNRINQLRCECQHLPPLMRWTAGEACADMMAAYDGARPGNYHAGFMADICEPRGYGQNECPGWPSVDSEVSGCLQQMWDEGPGSDFSMHGHYLNMTNASFTMVACGFATGMDGQYAVQDFQ
jgi:hypothetical protein